MKAPLPALFLALSLAATEMRAQAPDLRADRPAAETAGPIHDRTGAILANPRITDFDGANFTVEHYGGIARIPFDQMPQAYRKFFLPDPERAKEEADRRRKMVEDAQRQAILEVQRGLLERQMRANLEAKRAQPTTAIRQGPTNDPPTAYTSREINDPTKPMRFEVSLPQGVVTELFPLGGPLMSLELVAVDDEAVAVRQSRRDRKLVVKVQRGRENSGQNLTWLYSDKYGCSVYWVDTLRKPTDGGIFVFEYAPQSPLRPGSPVREQLVQTPKRP